MLEAVFTFEILVFIAYFLQKSLATNNDDLNNRPDYEYIIFQNRPDTVENECINRESHLSEPPYGKLIECNRKRKEHIEIINRTYKIDEIAEDIVNRKIFKTTSRANFIKSRITEYVSPRSRDKLPSNSMQKISTGHNDIDVKQVHPEFEESKFQLGKNKARKDDRNQTIEVNETSIEQEYPDTTLSSPNENNDRSTSEDTGKLETLNKSVIKDYKLAGNEIMASADSNKISNDEINGSSNLNSDKTIVNSSKHISHEDYNTTVNSSKHISHEDYKSSAFLGSGSTDEKINLKILENQPVDLLVNENYTKSKKSAINHVNRLELKKSEAQPSFFSTILRKSETFNNEESIGDAQRPNSFPNSSIKLSQKSLGKRSCSIINNIPGKESTTNSIMEIFGPENPSGPGKQSGNIKISTRNKKTSEDEKELPEDDKKQPEDDKKQPENDKKQPEDDKKQPEDDKKQPEDNKKQPEDDKKQPEDDKKSLSVNKKIHSAKENIQNKYEGLETIVGYQKYGKIIPKYNYNDGYSLEDKTQNEIKSKRIRVVSVKSNEKQRRGDKKLHDIKNELHNLPVHQKTLENIGNFKDNEKINKFNKRVNEIKEKFQNRMLSKKRTCLPKDGAEYENSNLIKTLNSCFYVYFDIQKYIAVYNNTKVISFYTFDTNEKFSCFCDKMSGSECYMTDKITYEWLTENILFDPSGRPYKKISAAFYSDVELIFEDINVIWEIYGKIRAIKTGKERYMVIYITGYENYTNAANLGKCSDNFYLHYPGETKFTKSKISWNANVLSNLRSSEKTCNLYEMCIDYDEKYDKLAMTTTTPVLYLKMNVSIVENETTFFEIYFCNQITGENYTFHLNFCNQKLETINSIKNVDIPKKLGSPKKYETGKTKIAYHEKIIENLFGVISKIHFNPLAHMGMLISRKLYDDPVFFISDSSNRVIPCCNDVKPFWLLNIQDYIQKIHSYAESINTNVYFIGKSTLRDCKGDLCKFLKVNTNQTIFVDTRNSGKVTGEKYILLILGQCKKGFICKNYILYSKEDGIYYAANVPFYDRDMKRLWTFLSESLKCSKHHYIFF